MFYDFDKMNVYLVPECKNTDASWALWQELTHGERTKQIFSYFMEREFDDVCLSVISVKVAIFDEGTFLIKILAWFDTTVITYISNVCKVTRNKAGEIINIREDDKTTRRVHNFVREDCC